MTRRSSPPMTTAGRAGLVPTCPLTSSAEQPAHMPLPRGGRAATLSAINAELQALPWKLPGKRAFQSEHVLQIAVADYLDRALPPDAFWTSIDSAGRGARDGARMKRRGVKRGLPDIMILAGAPNHYTIWLELKSVTGSITKEQKAFHRIAAEHAHIYFVCRSVDAVETNLTTCGIPLRARVAA